jgi:deoxyribonuclease V
MGRFYGLSSFTGIPKTLRKVPTEEELKNLREIQLKIAKMVIRVDDFRNPPRLVCGVDIAFLDEEAVASCIVMDFPPRRVVESKTASAALRFPYIPTLLAFREGPLIVEVISSLTSDPDVFLINAHGVAHPLRCGCASHVGVKAEKPTIGVTTAKLMGEYREPAEEGGTEALKIEGEQVGWVLRTRRCCRPIFVSPGHRVGMQASLEIVKTCLLGHKLPEPLRLAHMTAKDERRRLAKESRPLHQ